MTLPHLHVSLRGVFEWGQAYVALSRATDLSSKAAGWWGGLAALVSSGLNILFAPPTTTRGSALHRALQPHGRPRTPAVRAQRR